MSITLYGMGHSRSFRCLWALEEAELEYSFVSLDLASDAADGAKSSEYIKLNTQGKVPTLVHHDNGEGKFILTESAAILNYIDRLSSHHLIPDDPKERARYDELTFFIMTELEQPLWTTGKHKFAIPKEHRVQAVLETARWEFSKAVSALDSLCQINSQQQECALGDRFTMADILLAQTINWADRFKFEVPEQYLKYRDHHYSRNAAIRALAKFE